MKSSSRQMKINLCSPLLLFAIASFTYCHSSDTIKVSEPYFAKSSLDSSQINSPEEAIGKMRIAEGFEVKLVASEPLVQTPVALSFDANGRMWVVEMTSYMPDTTGRGEENKKGKVVILEDKDKDGVMDSRKVFLDSLVMPRAICFVENGVLIAEPPNLWYYEIGHH